MASFARSYLNFLKTHPVKANLVHSVVLMSFGDILAQEIERSKACDAIFGSEGAKEQKVETTNKRGNARKVNLRRYATHVPPLKRKSRGILQNNMNMEGHQSEQDITKWLQLKVSNFEKFIRHKYEDIRHNYDEIDKARTLSMMGWGAMFSTPVTLVTFQFFEYAFPKKSMRTIVYRVVISSMLSLPMIGLFLTYGTFVHQTLEWFALNYIPAKKDFPKIINRDHDIDDDMNLNTYIEYDIKKILETSKLKVEQELLPTFKRSVSYWIPIHLFNFSVVPLYLRPLTFNLFAIVWNTYLSLVQHRDIPLSHEHEE